MGFEGLLGNDRLKENLTQSIRRGHISHFYLITGPKGAGKKTLARLLAAALLCRGEDKPCGVCPACRKVFGAGHPDFITVDDPEKKIVPVALVRSARDDMFIRPNEADRKIYLFPRGQDMNIEGQNALLKVLEEPPAYGVFLLLAENPESLLPTVRSRSTELNLKALPEDLLSAQLRREFPQAQADLLSAAVSRSGGYLGQARQLLHEGAQIPPQTQQFVDAYCKNNPLEMMTLLSGMEKWKRDDLIEILQAWTLLLQSALVARSGGSAAVALAKTLASGCTGQRLLEGIGHLQKCTQYAQGNVSSAAICGYLIWALR